MRDFSDIEETNKPTFVMEKLVVNHAIRFQSLPNLYKQRTLELATLTELHSAHRM
jgi:hypothetical protein